MYGCPAKPTIINHVPNDCIFVVSGIVGSLFSFLQFVASPVIGAASDVYGRRPLMILTMVSLTYYWRSSSLF